MSEEVKNNKTMHWILGGVLLLIGAIIIIALVVVYSQGVSTTAGIDNAAPTVTSVFVGAAANGGTDDYAGGITLTGGTGATIHINGVVTDDNGAADIISVETVFYRSSVTNACAADDNDCYKIPSCTLTANDATSKNYDCEVSLEYFADSTVTGGVAPAEAWETYVVVTDAKPQTGDHGAHADIEMNLTLALTIPSTIAYGTHALGFSHTAANNIEIIQTQQGNDEATVSVSSAAAMSCTIGTIPVANQEWSITDVDHGSGTDLTGTPTATLLDVAYQTAGPTTDILYWSLEIPATGVGGSCTGTNTVTAVAK
ncbi:MAG: hypothetical protein ABID45_03725 [Patescibacteria group bacterium]